MLLVFIPLWHIGCFTLNKICKMKKEIYETIQFDNPADLIYWSKKWEISPVKLFSVFKKIKSNSVDKLKDHLRRDGFAL
jgi:hypothetical protein